MTRRLLAPAWWVPASLVDADPRTPYGRLLGLLTAHYAALTGTDAAACQAALSTLRLALEAEERALLRAGQEDTP